MSETALFDTVLKELHARKGTWRVIAHRTGLDYDWLCKMAQGQIKDPGVRKIERLAQYFRDTPSDGGDRMPQKVAA